VRYGRGHVHLAPATRDPWRVCDNPACCCPCPGTPSAQAPPPPQQVERSSHTPAGRPTCSISGQVLARVQSGPGRGRERSHRQPRLPLARARCSLHTTPAPASTPQPNSPLIHAAARIHRGVSASLSACMCMSASTLPRVTASLSHNQHARWNIVLRTGSFIQYHSARRYKTVIIALGSLIAIKLSREGVSRRFHCE